jgi:hypothetical protein
MAGSWREILESAAADQADDHWSVRSGEDHRDAESQSEEQTASAQLQPPVEARGFNEPELAAFMTRLASPPDTASAGLDEDAAAAAGRRPPASRERPAGNSLVVAVTATAQEKAALPACIPQPVVRKRRATRDLLATMLLAATMGLSAYALLSPGGKTPDTAHSAKSQSASSNGRVQAKSRAHSHQTRARRSRHRRTNAERREWWRANARRRERWRRCWYEPYLPGCRGRRYWD